MTEDVIAGSPISDNFRDESPWRSSYRAVNNRVPVSQEKFVLSVRNSCIVGAIAAPRWPPRFDKVCASVQHNFIVLTFAGSGRLDWIVDLE